ncbi:DsbE family thiol:disulfide interchange protein [Thiorhodovibrio frisius]|uniref:Periplasmic protein thiol:disulfide oxidoreductase, DsbE subfamily n=1 Tax=Thiorhodovibrio frisius TaxID=631362 RepID=H8Z7Q3_9GAMM|nr:DsbE family thiol:disulfide interchange protein [Thiorhodovibrio frisius]EIC19906.1 periplasmic protein thiol:disulfide oxidoreductase, DsbE subfamily [Thiorhodovibrio frisius]WPL20634.1 Cytochrome c biogenesis protein CcmG [Thiorhodovibrio frisius]
MTEATNKKSSTLRFLVPLIIFGALAGLLLYGLGQDPREVPSPLIGKAAPEFKLPDLLDPSRSVSNADLDGKISLVNVWASWCGACRAEHGMLMELSRRKDIQLIGLNWKDDQADATQVIRMSGNPYQLIAFDPDNNSGIDWGVYGAPETFVVDRNGIIRHKHIGPIDPEVWQQTLEPIIAKLQREQPDPTSNPVR